MGKIKYYIYWYILGGKIRSSLFQRQRILNQKHCYDYPSENANWHKEGISPVYGNNNTGSVFDPYVFHYEGFFYMIVSRRNDGCIVLLKSIDGKNWKAVTTLLSGIKNTWENDVNRACLIHKDGIWHLWYTGQENNRSCIGHICSRNLHNFKRDTRSKPILAPNIASKFKSYMNPCVIWNEDNKKFQMWFSAGDNYEPDVICYAESKDGFDWNCSEKTVLTKYESNKWEQYKIGGCCVMRMTDGSYLMHYIGYQNVDVARICFATSKDGIHWYRDNNNLCVAPSENSWDKHACYKPSVIEYDNKLYMWYNGRNDDNEYIGLAIKNTQYDKI